MLLFYLEYLRQAYSNKWGNKIAFSIATILVHNTDKQLVYVSASATYQFEQLNDKYKIY